MDTPFLFIFLSVATVLVFFVYSRRQQKSNKLPPGPYPLLIVGNIFQLSGGIFHETLAKLSRNYGPLMTIRQGNRTAIVVSSPKFAKELLQNYDHTFIKRVVIDAARALDHHKFSLGWLLADSQWRNLRKLFKEQIFSSERLNASAELRQEKVQQLCNYVNQCCVNGLAVDVGAAAFTTSLNLISNILFSIDFGDYDSNSSHHTKEIVSGALKTLGTPNLSDFFHFLKVIDPQGIRRRTEFYLGKLIDIFDDIISQRLQERATSLIYSRKNDLLEVLIDVCQRNESEWSYKDIKHLLVDIFTGGTDTNSSTVEWAMAELLKNPEKMAKTRAEIREIIGQSEVIQESDIARLPYLQAVVKETFRLHPAAPLTGRQPNTDIKIDQYVMPKDSLIIVNLWAIGRDSRTWSNPNSFVPERFLDSEIDAKGQHFELLPFGTGRRICIGMPLAHRVVHYMLASFLQKYDWKLEEGMQPETMDMSENFGLTIHKAIPLKAIPIRTTL